MLNERRSWIGLRRQRMGSGMPVSAPFVPAAILSAALVLGLASGLLALTSGTVLGALSSGPWPMFHRDPAHTGLTSLPAPTVGNIVWSVWTTDTVEYSSPVIGHGGALYIGNSDKELCAVTLGGLMYWLRVTGGNIRYSTPAVGSDGTIYVGSSDGKLYAYTSTGNLNWMFTTGGAVKTSPAIAPDGTIYIGSDDRKLWAVNPNGTLKWSYTTGDTIRSSPALGSNGVIYFGSYDHYLYALNPNGTLKWRGATGGPIRGSSPAYYHGNIIFGSSDGFLYSVRETDGNLNWATYTANNIRSSPAIGLTGKIYLGIDTKIVCYHDDGTVAWDYDTGARVYSTPAVTAGADSIDVCLCGSDNGRLYAFRSSTLLWTAIIGSPIRSSPAIGENGLAFVGAMNGRVYAIGAGIPQDVELVDTAGLVRLAVGPNPISGNGSVWFRVLGSGNDRPRTDRVTIQDVTGRRVATLTLDSGQAAAWNGTDEAGRGVPAGVYLYRYQGIGRRNESGRLVRLH